MHTYENRCRDDHHLFPRLLPSLKILEGFWLGAPGERVRDERSRERYTEETY